MEVCDLKRMRRNVTMHATKNDDTRMMTVRVVIWRCAALNAARYAKYTQICNHMMMTLYGCHEIASYDVT